MKKIKILFYSHTIDFAGTWRSHERILLNLNKDIFDVYVFYNPNQLNNRLDYLKTQMDNNKIIPFFASVEKLGPEYGYPYRENNFIELAKEMKFDIVHFARSGYYEWPFVDRFASFQIETNIFGGADISPFLDYSVAICETIKNISGNSDAILYNPIPSPIDDNNDLREELNITDEYYIFGRIGRKAGFHPIALQALKSLKDLGIKFKYIIIGACEQIISLINNLNLNEDCIIIEPTNDDYYIHKFHNTIDVFLHYRSDGECHSTALGQAMMYGVPIISHYAGYNGQSETIKDGGYVAHNQNDYLKFLLKLLDNDTFYDKISINAKIRSKEFEQNKIVKKWENIYLKLINRNEI